MATLVLFAKFPEPGQVKTRLGKRIGMELERQKEVNNRSLDVETARVNYENARIEEERQRELYEDGVVSQQDYNRFKVDMEVAKAAYENAKIVSGNDLKRFEADLDIRQQELQAAINNLQLLREGAARNSKQIANIVTSTVDGMVLDIPVEEGSSVIERNLAVEVVWIYISSDWATDSIKC